MDPELSMTYFKKWQKSYWKSCPQLYHNCIFLLERQRCDSFLVFTPASDVILMPNIAVFALRKFSTLTCLRKHFHTNLQDYIWYLGRSEVFSVQLIRIRANWVFRPFLKRSLPSSTYLFMYFDLNISLILHNIT